MCRLAVWLACAAVLACGDFPAETSADCAEHLVLTDHSFADRLADIQRTCDVFPWIEVMRLGPAPADAEAPAPPVPYTFTGAAFKRSYSLLIREFGLLAYSRGIDPGLASGVVTDLPVDIQVEVESVRQSSHPILSRASLGDLDRGWHGFRDGLYVPRETQVSFDITTRGRVYSQGWVYLAARGYRLYPKGTISPVQHSEEEHRQMGMKLVPYSYTQSVALEGTETGRASLLISDDFLAFGVRTSAPGIGTYPSDAPMGPGDTGGVGQAIMLRLAMDRLLMSGPTARMLAAGPTRFNAWDWDHPVTIAANTTMDIEASLDHGYSTNGELVEVQVVVHGYKLERVR